MLALFLIFLILACIMFGLAAANIPSNVNLLALGLLFLALYFLASNGAGLDLGHSDLFRSR